MPEPIFEVSREGIKLSYSRFLGDSATGFVVELLAALSYYFPLFGKPLKDVIAQPIGTEVKIFLLVLLFLLSTPIGLVLNATGWYLLSGLQIRLQSVFFHRDVWFLGTTKRQLAFEKSKEALGITGDRFFADTEFIDHALDLYFPHLVDPVPHVRGVHRLTRSLALVCLGPFFFELLRAISRYGFDRACAGRCLLWLAAFSILLVLGAAAGFFRALCDLQRLYMLMLKHGLLHVPEGSVQEYLWQVALREDAARARVG